MFSNDGRILASGPWDGIAHVWDLVARKRLNSFAIGASHILAVSGADRILTTSNNEMLVLRDIRSGLSVQAFMPAINWHILDAAFSLDGRTLAMGLEPIPELYPYDECRETIALWDVEGGQLSRLCEGDPPDRHRSAGAIRSVAFSRDGSLLASGSGHGTVTLWSVTTGERQREILRPDSAIDAVAFSPNHQALAFANEHGALMLWDLGRDRKPHKLQEGDSAVVNLAYSDDGAILAAAHHDGIRLWETEPVTRPLQILQGKWGKVRRIAFLPESWSLAAVYEEGWVQVWDGLTGRKTEGFNPSKPPGTRIENPISL